MADAWALAAPRLLGLEAVEADRFLGWDRLKERLFQARRRERPADRLSRTIWAAGIVARQGEAPFLRGIAGPGAPSTAFVPFFARLAPGLERVAARLRGPGGRALLARDEGLADLLLLRDDYGRFLADKGLFEPSWEAPRPAPGLARHLVVAPELIEDFAEYEERLRSLGSLVEFLPLPAALPMAEPRRHANAWEELRATFLEIGELLDGGLRPEDIAVTLPELGAARPWLEGAAAHAGVPLAVRGGEPLSATPFARLLREVRDAVAADFRYDALKALLLDRFAGWRDEEAASGLVRFGAERHAVAPWVEDGRKVDAWTATFARCAAPPGLRSFYRRLRAALRDIAGAGDFLSLRSAISSWRSQFLDDARWPEEEARRVQRAMAELDELARAEAELGAAGRLPSPLALFLSSLEQVTYVPRSAGARVAVYPYRVSALLPVERHFVLGCSQEAVTVSWDPVPFLREDQREALGGGALDASARFAAAYSLAGPALRASWAVEGLSGWSVPHPAWRGEPGRGAVGDRRDPDLASLLAADPIRAEAAAWRGEGAPPGRILAFQVRALESALPSLAPPAPSFGRVPASPAARATALARHLRADGRLRLSATGIGEYLSCPFAWLLKRGLGLEEERTGLAFFDARLAGEIAHAAIRRLLAGMALLGPIDAARLGEYRALAVGAAAEVLPGFEAGEGPFLAPMFAAYAPLLADRLGRLVDYLVKEPGWEAGELELELEKDYPGIGVVLEGRMDRIGKRGDRHWIVDYKKKRLPPVRDLTLGAAGPPAVAEDPEETEEAAVAAGQALGDWQVPAYVALAEANGRPVSRASYWSIESAKELLVLGEGGLRAREAYGPELAALDEALEAVAGGLRAGRLGPAPDPRRCQGCPWRAPCRARYATE